MLTIGRFTRRPMTPTMSRKGTPSSPNPCSREVVHERRVNDAIGRARARMQAVEVVDTQSSAPVLTLDPLSEGASVSARPRADH
jgi:hypothetical protein